MATRLEPYAKIVADIRQNIDSVKAAIGKSSSDNPLNQRITALRSKIQTLSTFQTKLENDVTELNKYYEGVTGKIGLFVDWLFQGNPLGQAQKTISEAQEEVTRLVDKAALAKGITNLEILQKTLAKTLAEYKIESAHFHQIQKQIAALKPEESSLSLKQALEKSRKVGRQYREKARDLHHQISEMTANNQRLKLDLVADVNSRIVQDEDTKMTT